MPSPRRLYNEAGPLIPHVRIGISAGEVIDIPENRNRMVLIVRGGGSGTVLRLKSLNGFSDLGVNVAAGSEVIYTTTLHGTLPQEAHDTVSVGNGNSAWFEVISKPEHLEVSAKGVVERYQEHLLRKQRERLREIIDRIELPPCQSLLLDTPAMFFQRQQGQSAIGGGGGEGGTESLSSASSGLIGD